MPQDWIEEGDQSISAPAQLILLPPAFLGLIHSYWRLLGKVPMQSGR